MQTQNPHFTMHHRHIACAAFLLLFTLYSSLFLHAQQVLHPTNLAATGTAQPPAPPIPIVTTTATTAPADDEVVELSPFLVTSRRDDSYTTLDTTSGSRIRTDLRDTAASISPFSAQFLQDIGASTLEDILAYGANIETDLGDNDPGFENSAAVNSALGNVNAFRIRGMSMTTAVDFVESSIPQNFYNIDRAEISSGPNSILFGTGQPGGMVTLTSKRANPQRNILKITNEFGTWNNTGDAWNYYQATIDYNLVLIPKTFAFRVMGLYQDGGNNSWRKWQANRDKRLNPAITFKPWKNTTISATYETGQRREPVAYQLNASDNLLAWLLNSNDPANPRPIQNIFNGPNGAGTPFYGITGKINNSADLNTSPYIVLVDNNDTLYDARMTLTTRGYLQTSNAAGTTYGQGEVRLPFKYSPIAYSVAGPAAVRNNKFDRYQFVIDQAAGPVNLQLGYYHNKVSAIAYGPTTWDIGLEGDPNAYISTYDWIPNGASAVKNPYVNQLYMEDFWGRRTGSSSNDVLRLSAEYTLNLKNWGRHRIIANLEHSYQENLNANYQEIIVDQQGRAIVNPDTPVGKNPTLNPAEYPNTTNPSNIPKNYGNSLWRRHYVTEGDFSTYYDSSWNTPMPPFTLNGRTFHSQYAFDDSDYPYHTRRQNDSLTLALQSYWLKDRLVTILGGRVDKVTLKREDYSDYIDNTTDPRLYGNGGQMAWHEHYFDGKWTKAPMKTPFTYNAGIVYHLADALSLYANTSSNRAAPDYAVLNTLPTTAPTDKTPWNALPTGAEPPQRVGRTLEAGIMYIVPGSKNLSLRLTYFDTASLHETVGRNSNDIKNSANNLMAIYTAFHQISPQLPSASQMTDAQFDAIYGNSTAASYYPYTIGLQDSYSKGFEAEITSQPLKNLTLRLTMSYTTRENQNMFSDVCDFYNANIPVWMRIANPALNGGRSYTIVDATGNESDLYRDILIPLIYGAGGIRDNLNNLAYKQSGVGGSRPLKFNLTARYNIPNNLLKGLAIGGGVRYLDQVRMAPAKSVQSNVSPVTPEDDPMSLLFDPNIYSGVKGMDKGSSLLFYDAFVSYKRKILNGRTNLTIQLNVKNLFNNYVVTTGQRAATSLDTGEVAFLRRLYVNAPRTIRLSATFDF